jgi:chromosome segregation ATPase
MEAQQQSGDPVSEMVHRTSRPGAQRTSDTSPRKKEAEVHNKQHGRRGENHETEPRPSASSFDDLARLRAQLDGLAQKLDQTVMGFQAEVAFLRDALSKKSTSTEAEEGSLRDLNSRLEKLRNSVSGVKGQLSQQYKTATEAHATAEHTAQMAQEFRDLVDEVTAGLEDVRTGLDELHAAVRGLSFTQRPWHQDQVLNGLRKGHLVAGTATTVGGSVLSQILFGSSASPVGASVLFLAGMLGYEFGQT